MIRSVFIAILAALSVVAQTAPAPPEFEVTSVKPAAPIAGAQQVNAGVHIDGALVRCEYLSLKDYLRMAYKVKDYQINGPEWMASERFDISAKLPAGAVRDQIPDMLKAVLADRFQMKMHRETKEFGVYGLVVAKGGLKMKESPLDPEPDNPEAGKGATNVAASGGPNGTVVNFGRGSYFTFGNNRLEGKKMTIANLADMLARFVDRPVVDMTDVKGNYDLLLQFSPEDFRAMMIRSALIAGVVLPPEALRALEGVSSDSIFATLQNVGLKLESRKAPLEVLVIDQALKVPTEN